jgi:hypothetical protein
MEGQLSGSSKTGKRVKMRYQISAIHRRAISYQEGEVVEGSEDDEVVAGPLEGGSLNSFPVTKGGSGIGILPRVRQSRRVIDEGAMLKKLAAKKELSIQKGSGVSHSMKEGPIIDKLVALEEVAVKFRLNREEERSRQ